MHGTASVARVFNSHLQVGCRSNGGKPILFYSTEEVGQLCTVSYIAKADLISHP
jgi:hypothetical protein